MPIAFQNEDISFSLKNRARLKQWIAMVIAGEKKQTGNINYVFMSDEALLQRNIDFLNHNTYTDIITFDYSEGKTVSGDILISVDRVSENARKFSVDFDTELRRVIIHGVLHLCGYKDKKPADKKLMRSLEDRAIKMWK